VAHNPVADSSGQIMLGDVRANLTVGLIPFGEMKEKDKKPSRIPVLAGAPVLLLCQVLYMIGDWSSYTLDRLSRPDGGLTPLYYHTCIKLDSTG